MFVQMLHRIREDDGQALDRVRTSALLIAIVAIVSVETFGLRVFAMYSTLSASIRDRRPSFELGRSGRRARSSWPSSERPCQHRSIT